jgi:hypothetical protein
VEVENMVKSLKRLKLVPTFYDFTANSILLETYFVTCTCVITQRMHKSKWCFNHIASLSKYNWGSYHMSLVYFPLLIFCNVHPDCEKNIVVYLLLFQTQLLSEFIIMLVLFFFFEIKEIIWQQLYITLMP